MTEKLQWKVHIHDLFTEIINGNKGNTIFKHPLNITQNILKEVAIRATELNDPKMNALMCRLSLYALSDPHDPAYDPALVERVIKGATEE